MRRAVVRTIRCQKSEMAFLCGLSRPRSLSMLHHCCTVCRPYLSSIELDLGSACLIAGHLPELETDLGALRIPIQISLYLGLDQIWPSHGMRSER
jgi:hypothetical protein